MKSVGIDLHMNTISTCTVDPQRRIVDRRRFLCSQPHQIRAYFAALGEFQAVTFSTPRQMNDEAFDHILGAQGLPNCPGARHMGEYIGVALTTDTNSATQYLYAAWTGNTMAEQQTIFGKALNQGDTCPWDLNGDGAVGAFDLASLLASWGLNPCGPPDFNGDGDVGPFDLASLLGAWGPCP